MAETSFGEGLGLQSGGRDNFWAAKTAELGQYNKAKKEKENDELVKLSDINIDYDKLPPAWGKRAAELYKNYLNTAAQYRQNDPRTAKNEIGLATNTLKQQLGTLYSGAERAKQYATAKGILKDTDAVSKIYDSKATLEDIQKLSDGNFIYADNEGGFNFAEIPEKSFDVKYDPIDFSEKLTGNRSVVGNQAYNELQKYVPEGVIKSKALDLSVQPEFIQTALFKNRALKPNDGESHEDFKRRQTDVIFQEAQSIAKNSVPFGSVRLDPSTIPQPPAADKKDEIISLKPLASYEVNSKVFDVDSNKSVDTKIPVQINIPVKTEASVLGSGYDILDVETNKQVSKDPTNLSFTPSTLQYKNIRRKAKDGTTKTSREWYVLGTAVDIAEQAKSVPPPPVKTDTETKGEYDKRYTDWSKLYNESENAPKAGSKKTTFNVQVPISAIKGKIKGVDLSELDAIAQEYEQRVEANKGGGKAISTTPTKTTTTYKYKVSKGGKTIFSADGQTWFDEKGNTVK